MILFAAGVAAAAAAARHQHKRHGGPAPNRPDLAAVVWTEVAASIRTLVRRLGRARTTR